MNLAESPNSTTTVTRKPILALNRISKKFSVVQALSNVFLELYSGEVTALIGENGAGKSTIVKILTGIYAPTEGEIYFEGEEIRFESAASAMEKGISAIYQETVLFGELSVAENIFIGYAPKTPLGLIDHKKMNADAKELLGRVGANFPATAILKDLGIAGRHLVAIARALSANAKIVIMDEPTASLSHKEILHLFELIETLKSDGKAILFISHKFDEIFKIADNYTVFRDGEMVGNGKLGDVTHDDLVHMMVGRSIDQIFSTCEHVIGNTALAVEDFNHPTEFADVNFDLKKGEILGFYGLIGSGRSELMQAIFGISQPASGKLKVNGKTTYIRNPADAVKKGIVYVPEDRGKQGIVIGLPIYQNITLPLLDKVSAFGFLKSKEEFNLTRQFTAPIDLRASSLDQDVGNLSGGNQQKVVIAKWLATQPKIIILDEPTKGIDIGSKAAVHEFMSKLAANGLAVVMVSSEIPEILGMSDRVMVMREGRIVAEFNLSTMTPNALVKAAAGI